VLVVNGQQQFNGQGQLKFSKDGLKVASVIPWYRNANNVFRPICELYTFNKTTGLLSNRFELDLGFNQGTPVASEKDGPAYGVEFSENGNVLYVSGSFASTGIGSLRSRLYQYNLLNSTKYKVSETGVIDPANPESHISFSQLLRGPDDKIYITRTGVGPNKMDVISNPNVIGSGCNFISQGLTVGGTVSVGLPTVTVFGQNPVSTPVITAPNFVCKGTVPTFNLSFTGATPASYYWIIYGSNAAGQPIDAAGNVQRFPEESYYKVISSSIGQFTPGVPPATITATGADVNSCGRYYSAMLTMKNNCNDYFFAKYTTGVSCNDPSFTLIQDRTNPNFFTLTAKLNDLTAGNYPGYNYEWSVAELDANNNWLFSILPSNWWIWTDDCTFRQFDHTANNYNNANSPYLSLPLTPSIPNGKFLYTRKYRISHGSYNSVCPFNQAIAILTPNLAKGEDGNPGFTITYYNDNDQSQTTTGLNTMSKSTTGLFTVYPNPSNGIFKVELQNEQKATMEVFDMTGKMIKTVQITNNDKYSLDLSGYAKGMYLIKMNGVQQQLQRILVE